MLAFAVKRACGQYDSGCYRQDSFGSLSCCSFSFPQRSPKVSQSVPPMPVVAMGPMFDSILRHVGVPSLATDFLLSCATTPSVTLFFSARAKGLWTCSFLRHKWARGASLPRTDFVSVQTPRRLRPEHRRTGRVAQSNSAGVPRRLATSCGTTSDRGLRGSLIQVFRPDGEFL